MLDYETYQMIEVPHKSSVAFLCWLRSSMPMSFLRINSYTMVGKVCEDCKCRQTMSLSLCSRQLKQGCIGIRVQPKKQQITFTLTRQGSHSCCTSANAPHSLKDILLLEAALYLLQITEVRCSTVVPDKQSFRALLRLESLDMKLLLTAVQAHRVRDVHQYKDNLTRL